jgi:hypothetical protein
MEPILAALIFMGGMMGLIIMGTRCSVYFYRHGALRLAASWRVLRVHHRRSTLN